MFFFCKLIATINSEYPSLFGKRDEEEIEENKEQIRKEKDSKESDTDETVTPFTQKWSWIIWIDKVSEVTKFNWHQVYDMQIKEFLNTICYVIDKANEENRQIEEWKRKH